MSRCFAVCLGYLDAHAGIWGIIRLLLLHAHNSHNIVLDFLSFVSFSLVLFLTLSIWVRWAVLLGCSDCSSA